MEKVKDPKIKPSAGPYTCLSSIDEVYKGKPKPNVGRVKKIIKADINKTEKEWRYRLWMR